MSIEDARTKLNNIRSSINTFATSRDTFKAQLLQRIGEINAMIPQIREKIEALKKQGQEVQRLRALNEQLTREKTDLQNQVQTLRGENESLRGQIQEKERLIQNLTTERDQLLADKQALESQIANLRQELADTRQVNASLQRQLDECKRELESIKPRLEQLTNELAQCNEEKNALIAERDALRGQLETVNRALQEAIAQKETIQQQLNALIADVMETASSVEQFIAANPQTDDPEMTRQLDELRNQLIELMRQLEMDTSRRELPPFPPEFQGPPVLTEDEKRKRFKLVPNKNIPLPANLPQIFSDLNRTLDMKSNLIKLMQISETYKDEYGNSVRMPQITREELSDNEYKFFKDNYKLYLKYWNLNPATFGGRLKKRKTLKKQKKQYKHKYMKGGWVYKGDSRLDSESTVISESRSKSGSKTKSRSISKSGNKRKSIRKIKNKGTLTRKRNRK